MHFRYVAYRLDEGIVKAELEARNQAEAETEIALRGYKLLEFMGGRSAPSLEKVFPSLYRAGTGEVVRFSRQLSTMVASGGNLLDALSMLHREARNKVMRRTLDAVRTSLDEGDSLSQALARHPKLFSPMFVSLVEVGESTGRLGQAMDQLADILEKDQEAKQKAMRTMMYPLAILGLSVVTLGVLMVVALPPLLGVLEQMGTDVPLVTRVLLGLTGLVSNYIIHMVLGLVGFMMALNMLRRYPTTRYWVDKTYTKLPLFGGLIVAQELTRFSRTLALLLEAGVSLSAALSLGVSACGNRVMHQAFVDAQETLIDGARLADALRKHPIVPTMFVELMVIGEESNSLQRAMSDASMSYQKQMENKLDGLLSMMEPASTMVVGGVVALIAFSMFVPIYSGLDAIP